MRATIEFDGASVTILPRRAPVGNSGPIRGRALAVVPGDPPPTLDADLGTVVQATVEPGARPGFAILDLGEDAAAELGRMLGIPELLYGDGRRARLLSCSNDTANEF